MVFSSKNKNFLGIFRLRFRQLADGLEGKFLKNSGPFFLKWSRADWALVVLVCLLLLPAIFTGGREPVGQALLFAFVAFFVFLQPIGPAFRDPVTKGLAYSLFLFLFLTLVSISVSFDRYQTAREFVLLLVAGIVFFTSATLLVETRRTQLLFRWLLVGGIIFSAYGLFIYWETDIFFRLGSVFYQQNSFS